MQQDDDTVEEINYDTSEDTAECNLSSDIEEDDLDHQHEV